MKKTVRWGPNEKRHYIPDLPAKSADEEVIDFLKQKITHHKYDELKIKLHNKLPAHYIIKALSTDKYYIFKWVAKDGNIEALKFLINILPTIEAKKQMIEFNRGEILENFLNAMYTNYTLGRYDSKQCQEGMKAFLNINESLVISKTITIRIEMARAGKSLPKEINEDLIIALNCVEREQQASISVDHTVIDDSALSTDATHMNDTDVVNMKMEEGKVSNGHHHAARSHDKNDTSKPSEKDLSDQELEAASSDNKPDNDDNSETIVNSTLAQTHDSLITSLIHMLFGWVKDLPQWLQDNIMKSSPVQNMLEVLEQQASNPETQIKKIFEDMNKSLEEKFEHDYQVDKGEKNNDIIDMDNKVQILPNNYNGIGAPDKDIKLDSDLLSYVPISILPTQTILANAALCLFISYGKTEMIKDPGIGQLASLACLGKIVYDSVSDGHTNGYHTNTHEMLAIGTIPEAY